MAQRPVDGLRTAQQMAHWTLDAILQMHIKATKGEDVVSNSIHSSAMAVTVKAHHPTILLSPHTAQLLAKMRSSSSMQ